jgi:hypothetical protein
LPAHKYIAYSDHLGEAYPFPVGFAAAVADREPAPDYSSPQQLVDLDAARHGLSAKDGKLDMLGHTGRSADGSVQLTYGHDNRIRNMDPGRDSLNLRWACSTGSRPQVG